MKTTEILKVQALVLLLLIIIGPADAVGSSLQSSSRALQHSVNAIGYSLAGSAQLVSGAASVPLGFVGSVGAISQDMSEELWEAANAEIGSPLPIADDIVTAGPTPSEAMSREPEMP